MTPKLLIFIAFAFLALHATPVIGARREFEFVLRWKWLNPDGYWRNVMTINDQFPGPVINITQGDMVSLKVKSELIRDVTSMHFHGLTMKGYPFMDGAAYVTQYPIMHMQTFHYEFEALDAGTYWYHAHMPLQYLDGLLGAFIVQSPTDPYKSLYDDEIVIVLQDFYHVDGIAMATPRPDNHHWLPFPIINGKGTFECNSTLEYARWCTPTERTEFKIKSGLRYRLRIIAATARVGLRLAISDHSLTVINRQGTDMNRFDTNEIYMSIADRYDVILNANKPIGEYLMRIKITGCDACNENGSVNVQPNLGYESWASFRYEGAAKGTAKDFTLFSENTLVPVSYLDERIVPLIAVHPPPATKTWTLTMTSERFFYDNDVAPHRKWFFNGKVFHHGAVPLLYEVIQGKRFSAEDDLIFTAELGDVVDVIFNTQHNQDHPLHLHGFKYFYLGGGPGIYNPATDASKLNLINPPLLDSVNSPGMSWTYLRIVADNPGAWLFHCHLDFHHKEDMAVAFVVAPEKISGPILKFDACDQYANVIAPRPTPISVPVTAPMGTAAPTSHGVDSPGSVSEPAEEQESSGGVNTAVVVFILAIVVLAVGGLIVWRICGGGADTSTRTPPPPKMTRLDVNAKYGDTKSVELDNMSTRV